MLQGMIGRGSPGSSHHLPAIGRGRRPARQIGDRTRSWRTVRCRNSLPCNTTPKACASGSTMLRRRPGCRSGRGPGGSKPIRQPNREIAEARLLIVVVIWELEEDFYSLTEASPTSESATPSSRRLSVLAKSGLVTGSSPLMRSDFFDRLEKLPRLLALSAGEARYILASSRSLPKSRKSSVRGRHEKRG